MIRNSGILQQAHAGMVNEAFTLYRDRDPAKRPTSGSADAFRKAFSDEADVVCVGVWDTVGSLGVPLGLFNQMNHSRFAFHDTTLSSHVKHAFHALAIDERRGPFAPTLWVQAPQDRDADANWLEQAWFTGVHSNVGGGYAEAGLSDIALCWMIDRVRTKVAERNGGSTLDFDDSLIEQMTRPDPTGRVYDSMSGVFKELGEYERPIDSPPGHAPDLNEALGGYTWEYVHSSVRQRYETQGFAEPTVRKNLAQYANRSQPRPRFGAALQAPWLYEDTPRDRANPKM